MSGLGQWRGMSGVSSWQMKSAKAHHGAVRVIVLFVLEKQTCCHHKFRSSFGVCLHNHRIAALICALHNGLNRSLQEDRAVFKS
jgi:hypothetical protein